MIYTTNFASLRKLPKEITPVAIALYPPKGWNGYSYKSLAPMAEDFREYKRSGNEEQLAESYIKHVLFPQSQKSVVQDIHNLIGGGDFALVCYEGSDKFCHRHLVAYWLSEGGYIVKEWGA